MLTKLVTYILNCSQKKQSNLVFLSFSTKRKSIIRMVENTESAIKEMNLGNKKQQQAPKQMPAYVEHRLNLWNKWAAEYKVWQAAQPRVTIVVEIKNEKHEAIAWETTPFALARKVLGQKVSDDIVIARVNGELWDLERPLECDSSIEFLDFTHPDGQYVFWHSSAHILGEAMECEYHGHLCYGPPVEEGFYYDMFMTQDRQVTPDDYKSLDSLCSKIMKEKQPFERLVLTKEQLHQMFDYNIFKDRIIKEKIDTPKTTVYRCGPLIDLCLGPHVRHTGRIGALAVTKNSSSYWMGSATAESLQRIYGISFPDSKQLKEWKHLQEEAAKRDHRKLGLEQELFYFDELSPGSAVFYPKGKHIYQKLIQLIEEEYWDREYTEVGTPNIWNTKLWEISGHWEHYAENMFKTEIEKEIHGVKPMNCPGHCRIFLSKLRSYKDLPLRFAEFGVLHRNELSGALSGMTRVRRFVQDDAHIFCRPDQIGEEIKSCLDFVKRIYELFGFTFEVNLSTRPEKFMGEIEVWNRAEEQLHQSLQEVGLPYKLNPGDGAFYGPKIDIRIQDALRRYHQCATIQLDFQLPQRFNLKYQGQPKSAEVLAGGSAGEETDFHRPVIIHRAILGSIERFMAILIEHCGGKWPYWLSPMQALIITVISDVDDYAVDVRKKLRAAKVMVDINTDPTETLNKKVRNAQLSQYNFILVVGANEKKSGTVNVRTRDNKQYGEISLDALIPKLQYLQQSRAKESEIEALFK